MVGKVLKLSSQRYITRPQIYRIAVQNEKGEYVAV